MKKIQLRGKRGGFALVDSEDHERFSGMNWYSGGHGVVRKVLKGEKRECDHVYLHREIMGSPKGMFIDHKNHDVFDNRKSNLRICKKQQNQFNQKVRSDNKLGIKGVHFRKDTKKWRACITINQKKYSLGNFSSSELARDAYNTKATELFGEFAWLNPLL